MVRPKQSFLAKLLIGNVTRLPRSRYNPLQKRLLNIKAIWNNDHQDDNGIEKIIRLLLSMSQMLFPGIYIKYLAWRKGVEYEDLALDGYILLKVLFPLLLLKYDWHEYHFLVYLMIYLLLETVLYIPTLIFASDLFSRPRSYKRSMLMLFFNYMEIVLAYAVLYSSGHFMNKPLDNWSDAVYFSIITSSSIGYGDFYPVTSYGRFLVSTQALLFLFFVVLFLNFFSTQIKSKGYFDHENKD